MRRAVKWIAGIFAGLVLLLVVTALAVRYLVDPNQFRGEIASVVQSHTGRQLTLGGNLELSVFPWLGVAFNDATLSNAPGFGDQPFAHIRHGELRARLMPLLQKRLEVDTVVLDGLDLNLARKPDGTTNWQDLAGGKAPARPEPQQPEGGSEVSPLGALAVGGLRLQDAHILWDDRQAKVRYELSDLDLDSGQLVDGKPFHLDLSLAYAASQGINGRLKAGSEVTADIGAKHLTLRDLALDLTADGQAVPGRKGRVQLAAKRFAAGADGGALAMEGLQLDSYGMRLSGDLRGEGEAATRLKGKLQWAVTDPAAAAAFIPAHLGEGSRLDAELALDRSSGELRAAPITGQIAKVSLKAELNGHRVFDSPHFDGLFQTERFSPRALLAALGQKIETTDPAALDHARVGFNFSGNPASVSLEKLDLVVDDSHLTGRFALPSFQGPSVRYDLTLDRIDLDRYLPPGQKAQPATPAGAAAAGGSALPVPLLRRLDIEGQLRIGALKLMQARSESVLVVLKGRGGQLRFHPLEARLYGGTYSGNTLLDVTGSEPRYALDEALRGIQAGPLLQDVMGSAPVTGRATVTARLNTRGNDPAVLRRNLDGTAAFDFRDGTIKGINVAQQLRIAAAALKGQPAPAAGPQQTDFAELSSSWRVADGIARNDDLLARSPLLRVTGKGLVDLGQERLDYVATATVVEGARELEELRKVPVPIRLEGPIKDPKISVDLQTLLETKGREALEQELRKRLGGGQQPQQRPGQPSAPVKPEDQLKNQLFDRLLKGR